MSNETLRDNVMLHVYKATAESFLNRARRPAMTYFATFATKLYPDNTYKGSIAYEKMLAHYDHKQEEIEIMRKLSDDPDDIHDDWHDLIF